MIFPGSSFHSLNPLTKRNLPSAAAAPSRMSLLEPAPGLNELSVPALPTALPQAPSITRVFPAASEALLAVRPQTTETACQVDGGLRGSKTPTKYLCT